MTNPEKSGDLFSFISGMADACLPPARQVHDKKTPSYNLNHLPPRPSPAVRDVTFVYYYD